MLTSAMRDFVADLERMHSADIGPETRAEQAARRLEKLLRSGDVLDARHMEPDPEAYRQHLVHVDPEGRFSVVSLVWLPGQETPVHSHVCWCVVGVLTGQEEEIRYHFDADERVLVETGTERNAPGEVCWLVPPEEDIHKVRNCGDTLAVSIHVYGANIAELGTSINRVYTEPVRAVV
ncbi:putative metal-dependent enzyme of the double-stranded beta helix superfamily [Streptoalloteichus tenebrarius]|uniref:Metal-dependent enzyme of the double-stranded beta helix superfamily n=1 Tax=Streptoalloteichus tenebrarius (strain ATCC 17920 / DSM 40477 / JCM 4838 / CBS 697.72 / NBRC 16177 / NCIMB 11028 / NRRL B-12390 / A12253. 1 / ISP 5477) TaxID=1933 RepID=A0ABT1HQI0_STRSD|nr:cysteine dioxygenase [Streptoalloteichus tenebrarius]MCP2257752.1 putative metal-dependent enzyme of the double-stranded beta helix superfamily [Streptoalloteichus tenebrarius]